MVDFKPVSGKDHLKVIAGASPASGQGQADSGGGGGMTGRVQDRMDELALRLPDPPKPAANYVPYVLVGQTIYVSGQIPLVDGEPTFIGQVGTDFDIEAGRKAARICALNVVAQVSDALDGDLDRVARVCKLTGFVNCSHEFYQQPKIIDAASELMLQIFDEAGRHSRSAVGVSALPFNVAVEIEAIFHIKP